VTFTSGLVWIADVGRLAPSHRKN